MENSVKVVGTRAALSTVEQDSLKNISRIRIYDGDGTLIRRYEGLDNVPSELKLASGNYRVRVTAGDSIPASRTRKFYQGEESFSVTKGAVVPVEVNCNIANTLATVTFDKTLDDAFDSDYTVAIYTSKGELLYNLLNADSIGYYMLTDESVLYCTFTAKSLSGGLFQKFDTIRNAKPATRYDLTYKYTAMPTDKGGAGLSVEVDETPVETNTENIQIFKRPVISLLDKDNIESSIDTPIILEVGSSDAMSLWVITSCPITSVQLACDQFTSWGLGYNSYNLVGLTSQELATLETGGIRLNKRTSLDGSSWGIVFSNELIEKITAIEGTYTIHISVADNQGNVTAKDWIISVSDATVITSEVVDATVWATKATLRAMEAKTPLNTVSFRYREVGTVDWSTVSATLSDTKEYTAEITGLKGGTKYEYVALDGEVVSNVICTFTTEIKAQPENAGFENWSQPAKPLLLYGDGQNMWWDSGNHGSSTMNKNVTQKGEDYKHSGSYSAKLISQFVGIGIIGKFAAGNAFVGKYLATDGTDGIIGWGRPFSSRPKSLKGYIRYRPGTVTDANVPGSVADFPKGSTDIGNIFIAIGDWAGETYGGETWPVIIKTKTVQLFNPQDAAIIAYGTKDWTADTSGDGMIEFEIPLDYRSETRKPTSIIIVASASKYGDYFSGGDSTMWLDDFELIYE